MATLNVPADYSTIAAAVAAAQPGDVIAIASGYAGPRIVTVGVENLTFDAPAGVTGVVLTAGSGVTQISLAGSAPMELRGNSANNTLTGNSNANVISGGAGDDLFNASGGPDTLRGEQGNDTFRINGSGGTVDGGADTDTVISNNFGTYAFSGVEILETVSIKGTAAQLSSFSTITDSNSTNSEIEVYLRGNGGTIDFSTRVAGEHTVYLNADDVTAGINVTGSHNDDLLRGSAFDDVLRGGGGSDSLLGGQGNDTYIIDGSDFIAEAANSGTDTVSTSASYILGANLENLTLTGAANINATGNALANVLTGNAGNNTLAGGLGTDRMIGGAGNDIYSVDQASDVVIEAVGGGIDTVVALNDYSLARGQEIEVLQLSTATGAGNFNLVGNEFANTLRGNSGNNSLFGNGGADSMYGGYGNDAYYVENAGDLVFEKINAGFDKVESTVSYVLASGQEVEVLLLSSATGSTALNLTGNEVVQTIRGNAGSNLIDGKAGSDTLYGNAGTDTFSFTTTLGSSNVDILADFSVADDTIRLSSAIFDGLSVGQLTSDAFKNITPGTGGTVDSTDRILYDRSTGALYFDADGSGSSASAVQFAALSTKPTNLSHLDFMIV